MPAVINKRAAAGAIQRAHAHGLLKDGRREWRACCGRIRPSCRNAISMEFQTRGLGSCAARSSPAAQAITSKSATNAAHSGQSLRCARCSGLLPWSSCTKLSRNSTQVIQLSPSLCYLDVLPLPSILRLFGLLAFASLCWLHVCFLLSCLYRPFRISLIFAYD